MPTSARRIDHPRHLTPLPPERWVNVPWVFLHEPAIKTERDLALAGLLVTTIPATAPGPSLDNQEAINAVGNQLLRDRRAGRLPAGLCRVWVDGRPMVPIQGTGDRWVTLSVERTSEQWLQWRMDGCTVVEMRVPLPSLAA